MKSFKNKLDEQIRTKKSPDTTTNEMQSYLSIIYNAMPNQFGFALLGSCVRSLHLYVYFEAANPTNTSTMSSGVLDMPLQGTGGSSQETHAARLTLDNIVRLCWFNIVQCYIIHVTIH